MLILYDYPEAYIECNGDREDDTCYVRCPAGYVGPDTMYTCTDDTSWYSEYPLECFEWYLWTFEPTNTTEYEEARYGHALDLHEDYVVIGSWGYQVFT